MENLDFFLSRYVNNTQEYAKFLAEMRAADDLHASLNDIAELRASIECLGDPTFDDMLPHFRHFLASDSVSKFFEQEAKCSLNSDIYQPKGKVLNNEIMTGLQFVESQRFAIAAIVVDPTALAFKKHRNRNKASSIRMTPKDVLVRFIRSGGAVVTVHTCAPITDATPATRDMQCQLDRTFEAKDGDEVVIRAGQGSFSFEASTSAVCVAQAYVKYASVSVIPEFDSRSLKLIGLSAANDTSSRVQLMSTVLRLFKQEAAFDDCMPFVNHPDYFVRWYVMRELLAMNPERAWPLVEAMAKNDPNQDVRRTASRTVELFQGPTPAA